MNPRFTFASSSLSSFPQDETFPSRPLSSLALPSPSLHNRPLLTTSPSGLLSLPSSQPFLSSRKFTTEIEAATTEEEHELVEEEEEQEEGETKSKRQREREEKAKRKQKMEEQKELNESIQNFLQLGKVGKAEEQLKILDEKGLFRDEDTSTLLIKAYCLLKEQDNVRGVIQTMKRQKVFLSFSFPFSSTQPSPSPHLPLFFFFFF